MKTVYYSIFFSLLVVVGIILSLHYSYISADAPYYLAVSRDISNNLIPYRDVFLSYTPLVMYFHSIIFDFAPNPPYNYFLIGQYFIIFLSALVLYSIITRFLKCRKDRAYLLCLFFILSVFSAEGSHIILEVHSIFFVLLGLWFFFRKDFILAGCFVGISFFCKQYGLLNFLPFLVYFVTVKNKSWLSLLKIGLGGLIPLVLFSGYFFINKQIDYVRIFSQINGQDYIEHSLYSFPDIIPFLIGSKVFILLLLPLLILKFNAWNWNNIQLFLITGILINLVPVLLQSFDHYYLNTFPFLFILIALIFENQPIRATHFYSASILVISAIFFLRIFRYDQKFEEQQTISLNMAKVVEKGSEVFLYGNVRYLYFLNGYRNPVVREIGYSYPFKPDEKFLDSVKVISASVLRKKKGRQIKFKNNCFYYYDNE